MTRIVVLGETGQLARQLASVADPDHDIVFLGRERLDLADMATIEPVLRELAPDAIINAAAYTAVDQAEDDAATAFAVNAHGPGEAARVANALGAVFLHVSTDYVFDGSKDGPYIETDPTAPLGVYGASKLAGEQAVLSALPRSAIFRTAWVHAPEGRNFVTTMLRLAADRPDLRVVGDQRGSPTYAKDLAVFLLQAVDVCVAAPEGAPAFGIFHVAGAGETSWAEFAETILTRAEAIGLIQKAPRIEAISTAEYPTRAERPANSILDCTKAERVFGSVPRPWRVALDDMLSNVAQQEIA